MANIAIYGSHNASITLEQDGTILEVVELERYLNQKNIGITQYLTAASRHHVVQDILRYFKEKYGIVEYEKCIYSNTDVIEIDGKHDTKDYIPAKEYINVLHHESHVASSLYQSTDTEILAISFDGGGSDGFFNIYHAKRGEDIKIIGRHVQDLGFPYMIFGEYLGDIKKEIDLSRGNLVYAGKIMGLSSYGEVREEWLEAFIEFYLSKVDGLNYVEKLNTLSEKTGLVFDRANQFMDKQAWDLAATSQKAFEEAFLSIANPYLDQYPDLPVHLTGGCALNILLNTRLKQEFNRKTFVAPNPNDCGLSSGMMLNYLRPDTATDLTYKGIEILDRNTLLEYVEEYLANTYELETVARDISNGAIVGVVRDSCEHGPRALGNRSILCNPAIPGMKDTLNAKVKHREWYRPFAPVVRLEDVSKYFEFEGESRWMGYCPLVKEEWRSKLPSITHVDNTARVQTVTREQNQFLYDLLTEFEKLTGIGVLLNTSFNIAGKPIVSTYRDAVWLYESSQMDRLLLQDYYFTIKFYKYRG